jgi:hypothetical protein
MLALDDRDVRVKRYRGKRRVGKRKGQERPVKAL